MIFKKNLINNVSICKNLLFKNINFSKMCFYGTQYPINNALFGHTEEEIQVSIYNVMFNL